MKAASVLLTTYNDDHRLELCLSGYAAQSLKNFELLIVNDGGPRPGGVDNTRALVERFTPHLDVRYLYLEPESEDFRLAAARNFGIRQAGGKTLIISDGDCVPHPNLVQLLIQYARDDRLLIGIRKRIPEDAVASVTSADLPNLPNFVWLDDERLCVLGESTRQTFLGLKDSVPPKGWQYCWGCLFAAPLWKFKALGGFDERFISWGGEDHDMAERLVRGAGCRLYSLPEAVVYHLDHPGRDNNLEQSRALLAELRKNFLPIRNSGPMPPNPGPAVADAAVTDPASKRPAGKQKVSLCLIVKNEEDNLAPCLISAADLVDEMVVVDTGSTDRTKELAASCGARVFDFAWVDSFAAARNESVRCATGDWILWLDGDEHFDDDNRQKLRALFASSATSPASAGATAYTSRSCRRCARQAMTCASPTSSSNTPATRTWCCVSAKPSATYGSCTWSTPSAPTTRSPYSTSAGPSRSWAGRPKHCPFCAAAWRARGRATLSCANSTPC